MGEGMEEAWLGLGFFGEFGMIPFCVSQGLGIHVQLVSLLAAAS